MSCKKGLDENIINLIMENDKLRKLIADKEIRKKDIYKR